MSGREKHALVVVLGDLGHSPRMKNHVVELLESQFSVDFAGYLESELPNELVQNEGFRKVYIPSFRFEWLPRIVQIICKVFFQTLYLFWMGMFKVRRPNVIIVQTPPVLPTLMVLPIISWWHNSMYVVDWHNVGYTILAQRISSPAIVAVAKAIELYLSKFAHINLVVSEALGQWMQINAGIKSIVLYDRPDTSQFQPLKANEKTAFRKKIRGRIGWDTTADVPLIVSSTSWTPDEDFSMFVRALEILEGLGVSMQVIVTGKGPLKAQYEETISHLHFRNVQFATVWLSYEDYATLLASADVGVCLHSSSSGLDLPMKAIDMIGASLPIVAFRYAAITELIEDGVNGVLFGTPEELADCIQNLVEGRVKYSTAQLESWHDHWNNSIGRIIRLREL